MSKQLGFMENTEEDETSSLHDRFVVPPFSVLSARQGYWQKRKKQWMGLGIKGETTRESMTTKSGEGGREGTVPGYYDKKEQKERELGRELSKEEFVEEYLYDMMPEDSTVKSTESGGVLSVFDPVLTELNYRWFCPQGGHILDPFAGGPVRGIVAKELGHNYTGVELRKEQVRANKNNLQNIYDNPDQTDKENIIWKQGNSTKIKEIVSDKYDFIFSCPPYYDLEVYSQEEGELSAKENYENFLDSYKTIIKESVDLLKDNRFAAFVVQNIRGEHYYHDFVGDTIRIFEEAGMGFYNEAILVTPLGTVQLRAGKHFQALRKLEKTHQNLLIFYKGDIDKIREYDIDSQNLQRAMQNLG